MRARPGAAACFHCGALVEGHYREVLGWEKRRAPGSKGGLHGLLRGAKETGRYACDDCGYKISRGIPLDQGSLFS